MKNLKYFFGLALTIMMTLSFTSCQTDEEIGFDISGLYGKIWEVDLGESVFDKYDNEYPIYSEFEFNAGAYNDYGVGREERFYLDDDSRFDGPHSFNWELQGGNMQLRYNFHRWTDVDCFLYFYELITHPNYWSAYVEDDKFRTEFTYVGTRSITPKESEDNVKVVKGRRKITFRVKK